MAVSMKGEKIDISIVIPIRNEAPNILPLADEIKSIMEREFQKWECIWVDDGSTDASLATLRELALADRRHRYVSFEQNTGQSAALWAGFSEARASIIATIDGDGQNDPADIPTLFRTVVSGAADMANGYRASRQDNFKRKISSILGNGFRTMLTGKTVRDAGCSTRVFRRECIESLPRFTGMHRWLPTLAAMQGFKLTEAPVNHRPRIKGHSKYSISNRLWVTLADAFGVFWLKKRAFHYNIKAGSDFEAGPSTDAGPPR
ncbi:MAG: glycosyltransferase family 2 protein [Syntrophobacteraceae bacterium]|jgi:dolichol-phosphate mannosyltransferase